MTRFQSPALFSSFIELWGVASRQRKCLVEFGGIVRKMGCSLPLLNQQTAKSTQALITVPECQCKEGVVLLTLEKGTDTAANVKRQPQQHEVSISVAPCDAHSQAPSS